MKGDSRSKVNVNKSEVAGRIVAGSATIHAAIVVSKHWHSQIMIDTLKYKTQSLTVKEIQTLTKTLKRWYLTGLIILCMVTILYLIVVYALVERLPKEFIFVLIVLDVVILLLTGLLTSNLRNDISNGIKELREYQVFDKISYLDDDPGLDAGPRMKFQLITKFKRFSVDQDFYDKAKINDWIIEHESPLTKESLKLELK